MNALKQRLQVEPPSLQGLPTRRAIASTGKARRPGGLLPSRTYHHIGRRDPVRLVDLADYVPQ